MIYAWSDNKAYYDSINLTNCVACFVKLEIHQVQSDGSFSQQMLESNLGIKN
jgi:hypothetical protein